MVRSLGIKAASHHDIVSKHSPKYIKCVSKPTSIGQKLPHQGPDSKIYLIHLSTVWKQRKASASAPAQTAQTTPTVSNVQPARRRARRVFSADKTALNETG
jgi:hypothetical protein